MKGLRAWSTGMLLGLATLPALAQERPYTDGPVVVVSSIKVVDGQFENYMSWLSGNWRRSQEAAKKAGFVTDYHVYSAEAHNPQEPDLYLVVSYPNMAALDGMNEKMDPIMAQVMKMDYKQADEASGKRTVMRTLYGQETLRELLFK